MTTLTADGAALQYEQCPDEVNVRLTAAAALYFPQFLAHDTTAEQVRNVQDDATGGFAGILNSAEVASGDVVNVRQRGEYVTSVIGTVAVGDEGVTVYADTDGTANNNPLDVTLDSTNNMPIGVIKRVITAGTDSNNSVVVRFEADGLASR